MLGFSCDLHVCDVRSLSGVSACCSAPCDPDRRCVKTDTSCCLQWSAAGTLFPPLLQFLILPTVCAHGFQHTLPPLLPVCFRLTSGSLFFTSSSYFFRSLFTLFTHHLSELQRNRVKCVSTHTHTRTHTYQPSAGKWRRLTLINSGHMSISR